MEYSNEFKHFVDVCTKPKNNFYVGIGDPNARILIVGKESALSEVNLEYKNNAAEWRKHIENHDCQDLKYHVNKEHPLHRGWGHNTWSYYQKLNDYIFDVEEIKPYYIDFLKNMFTTEINDAPNPKTSQADKSSINARKRLFKESAFIQSFPVIVLACSNYIQNNNSIREIDDIFGVTYDGDENGKHYYNKGNWFFTHHNVSGNKLVIHTRQLSMDVKNEMLKEMAEVIKKHLKI